VLYLHRLAAWLAAHPDQAIGMAAAAVALLRVLYALVSRLVAPYPRLRAVVEAVAALGPDLARAVLQLLRAVTGRPMPSPDLDARDAELADLRRRVMLLGARSIPPTPPAPPSAEPPAGQP
jgi:hypothetical protein